MNVLMNDVYSIYTNPRGALFSVDTSLIKNSSVERASQWQFLSSSETAYTKWFDNQSRIMFHPLLDHQTHNHCSHLRCLCRMLWRNNVCVAGCQWGEKWEWASHDLMRLVLSYYLIWPVSVLGISVTSNTWTWRNHCIHQNSRSLTTEVEKSSTVGNNRDRGDESIVNSTHRSEPSDVGNDDNPSFTKLVTQIHQLEWKCIWETSPQNI
jgi:hypothetical protein